MTLAALGGWPLRSRMRLAWSRFAAIWGAGLPSGRSPLRRGLRDWSAPSEFRPDAKGRIVVSAAISNRRVAGIYAIGDCIAGSDARSQSRARSVSLRSSSIAAGFRPRQLRRHSLGHFHATRKSPRSAKPGRRANGSEGIAYPQGHFVLPVRTAEPARSPETDGQRGILQ